MNWHPHFLVQRGQLHGYVGSSRGSFLFRSSSHENIDHMPLRERGFHILLRELFLRDSQIESIVPVSFLDFHELLELLQLRIQGYSLTYILYTKTYMSRLYRTAREKAKKRALFELEIFDTVETISG